MLTIINQTPSKISSNLLAPLKNAKETDAVVFMGDGIYCRPTAFGKAKLFALEEHRLNRGATKHPSIEYVAMATVVELTEQHSQIMTL